MGLPLILILIATASASVVAYGVHPDWAQFERGLTIIMISRRLMWPLVAVSLIACLSLLGMVISGKRRAWFLIGLAPVLALFFHRFGPGTAGPGGVIESPLMVEANDRAAPEAGEYVVGLLFADRAYAFPYRALFSRPVVALTDYDQRMLLMWSAYANRAVAVALTRDLRPRDLEVVSTPANSLLVYHRRLGQFISGVTGRLIDGGEVTGFSKQLAARKTTWGVWRTQHPNTKVMAGWGGSAPAGPILPVYKLRVPPMPEPATLVTMLSTQPPAAVRDDVRIDRPMNAVVGSTRVLILRDGLGKLRAFDRHLKEDLFLTFEQVLSRGSTALTTGKRPDAALRDVDTQSTWTIDGRCVEGPSKGEKLREIDVDDRLYWGVMKFWYPELELIEPGRS